MADLARQVESDCPALAVIWSRLAIAVDGELATSETPLSDSSEVALLPPVSGGSDDGRAALVDEAIDIDSLTKSAAHRSCGAVLLFVGNVRDRHQGRTVERITYDAYRPMALKTLEAIAADLEAADPEMRIRITHRLGEIPVGEASVAIAVASLHRQAAYDANRRALERLKREVPIWKQEHYADGQGVWREEEPLTDVDQRS